jgi:hypothetical protein
MLDKLKHKLRWKIKQATAGESTYYGDGGTIHSTTWLDVETFQGTVVAVWFRCRSLPFQQHEVDGRRASLMETHNWTPEGEPSGVQITGIEFK